jgi:putative acetyltransferase
VVVHAVALYGEVRLDVFEANAKARGFYQQMGFEERGRRADDDSGHPLIVMVRPQRPAT